MTDQQFFGLNCNAQYLIDLRDNTALETDITELNLTCHYLPPFFVLTNNNQYYFIITNRIFTSELRELKTEIKGTVLYASGKTIISSVTSDEASVSNETIIIYSFNGSTTNITSQYKLSKGEYVHHVFDSDTICTLQELKELSGLQILRIIRTSPASTANKPSTANTIYIQYVESAPTFNDNYFSYYDSKTKSITLTTYANNIKSISSSSLSSLDIKNTIPIGNGVFITSNDGKAYIYDFNGILKLDIDNVTSVSPVAYDSLLINYDHLLIYNTSLIYELLPTTMQKLTVPK